MNKLGLVKNAISFVASVGVGVVVKNAVQHTTPDNLDKLTKVGIVVGGFVVGSMIADQASKYAENQVDEVVDGVNKVKEAAHDAKEAFQKATDAAQAAQEKAEEEEPIEGKVVSDPQRGSSFHKP